MCPTFQRVFGANLIFNDTNRTAAGAHTTYFLAKPSDKLSELPIHPELTDLYEQCIVCEQDNGENDLPLECEKVRIRRLRLYLLYFYWPL